MGEWAWAAGIAPLLGPWRYGARPARLRPQGGLRPRGAARLPLQARGAERLHHPHRAAVHDRPERRRREVPAGAAARDLLGWRAPQPRGHPLVPRRVRADRARLLRADRVLPPVRELPERRGAGGLDGPAHAGVGRRAARRGREAGGRGERGEICLRARSNPHYPLGYWNRPEDTEEDFGGDWFHTKDAAEQDEDGYIWYAGRADDVIISAGYRIGPFEVESACVEHPAVKEAAAVGLARRAPRRRGQGVRGARRGPRAERGVAEEIKRFVRDRHSAYAYPREIEFVDDLPKTLTGKIRRIELREAERERKLGARRAGLGCRPGRAPGRPEEAGASRSSAPAEGPPPPDRARRLGRGGKHQHGSPERSRVSRFERSRRLGSVGHGVRTRPDATRRPTERAASTVSSVWLRVPRPGRAATRRQRERCGEVAHGVTPLRGARAIRRRPRTPARRRGRPRRARPTAATRLRSARRPARRPGGGRRPARSGGARPRRATARRSPRRPGARGRAPSPRAPARRARSPQA